MESGFSTSTHLSWYNSTSDDSSSSSSDESEHKPSHPGNTNTNTNTVSQNDNPILKEKEKKKKAAPEPRLLCSVGGEIVVDAHNNSSYSGGENRIITVERHCSYSVLKDRLRNDFYRILGSRSFTLNYKLPNHGLDLLITIRTDDELQNMFKIYDHVNRRGHEYNPLNLRLCILFGY